MAKKDPIQYKGFTINYLRREYRADAYASPQFTNTNLAKLKKEINEYLRDEPKGGSTYAEGGEITEVNEDGSNLPKPLYDLFTEMDLDRLGDYSYMEELRVEANEIGYDFNYDLSGEITEFWEIKKNKMEHGGSLDKFDAIVNKPVTYTLYDGDKVFLKTKSFNKASDTRTLEKFKGNVLDLEMKDSKGNIRVMKYEDGGEVVKKGYFKGFLSFLNW